MILINKALFLLSLFLFAFIPLYPKFPLFRFEETFAAIRIEDLLIAAVLLVWLIYNFKNKKWDFFTKDNIGKAFLLFFSIGAFSLFSAFFLTHTINMKLGIMHFARRIELMMLLPVCATVFTTRKRVIAALIVLVFTLLAVNIYGLGQQYLDWPVISTTNSEFAKGLILKLTPGARVNSTFAGHYDLAVFLAGALVFLTVFFFSIKIPGKILAIAFGGLSLFLLILTAARVSFIAAFIGIISALILSKKKKYLVLVLLILVLAGMYPSQLRDRFVSTVTINLFNLGQRYEGRNLNQQLENKLNIPTIFYRMASRSASVSVFASPSAGIPTDIAPGEPTNETDLAVYRSFQIRLNMEWPRAINAFLKNPLTGLGYSSLGLAADNEYLRSLGEVGLLGTAAFVLILLSIWKKIIKGIKNEDKLIRFFSAGTLSVIIVFLVNGLFIDVFAASKIASLFWMILGLNVAALKIDAKSEEK